MAKGSDDLWVRESEELDAWSDRSPRNLEIGDELRAELDRRLARLDQDGPVGTDWEDVLAEMKTADEL